MAGSITELSRADNFTPSRDTQFFLSGKYTYGENSPVRQADLGAALVLGDNTLTVATGGFGRLLYPGTIIYVGDSQNYVVVRTKTTSVTQTAIQIQPSRMALALGAPVPKCTIKAWVPFLSAKTFNFDTQNTEAQDSVFGDLSVEKFITEIMSTGSIGGPSVFGDPGMEIIKAAQFSGDRIYVEASYIGQRGGIGAECNVSVSQSGEKGNFLQSTINLTVSGLLTDIKPMATSPFSPNVTADYA